MNDDSVFPYFVYGEWPFVQQRFEHSKVAATHAQPRDALFGIGLHRPCRLPQDEEYVDAASASQ